MATGNRAAGSNRPLSPHLQVYRLPITAITSILHRFTGIALAAGTLVLVYWLAAAAAGPEAFAGASALLGSWIGRILLFGWSFALFYHLLNGIRHLFWDAGYGFEIGVAERASWTILIGAGVLTVLAWVAGLAL